MLHHAVSITSMEAKLFAIRCGINQATNLIGINKIIVITDSIHSTKKIFNSSSHSYQVHAVFISYELRNFFDTSCNNTIEFWECPSCCEWSLHRAINKEIKIFSLKPCYPCKTSWNFSKKRECNDILNIWKMTFQASDKKGHHFLDLLDNDNKSLEPTYFKGRIWLKYFGHSNSLCARAMRAIVNHTPIGEYWLRFFPKEDFKCLYREYCIEMRQYILYDCKRYNEYWNSRRDTIGHFMLFLEFNSNAFAFGESITWLLLYLVISFSLFSLFYFFILFFMWFVS